MGSLRTLAEENACKLATALIHLDEEARWRQSGRKGTPPTQATIAARLEVGVGKRFSQSTVSRWLKATENVYWRSDVTPIDDAVRHDPHLLQRAREIAFRANIADKVRRKVPKAAARRLLSIYAVTTSRSEPRAETIQEAYADFALGAAGRVVGLMGTGALWGVTWGRTVGAVIGHLVNDPLNRAAIDKAPKFVPLCGDPFDVLPTRDSSSVLAEQLEVFITGKPREVLSLRNVPAYIPERSAGFTPAEIEGIKKFMLRCRAYQSVFGTERFQAKSQPQSRFPGTPLADQLDGIVTSLSGEGRTFGFGSWSMIPVSKKEKLWLDRNAFDIGRVCLARSTPDGKGRALIERIRKRWTGITHKQLEDCAERACRNPGADSPPGVVVLAVEEDKASAIASCLRLGLINHLICSAKLAERLEASIHGMATGEADQTPAM